MALHFFKPWPNSIGSEILMINVLIADDNPIIREGIKQIIAIALDIRVVGEADNGQQVLELIRKDYWDVVLLDINMPVKNGITT